jgi:hypothetical protein
MKGPQVIDGRSREICALLAYSFANYSCDGIETTPIGL